MILTYEDCQSRSLARRRRSGDVISSMRGFDDPAAKAVLERYIPALVSSPQIAMARSMALKQLQQYAADTLTDETLGKIQYDLSKLPLKP